jgi:hypothetical protein
MQLFTKLKLTPQNFVDIYSEFQTHGMQHV